MSPEEYLDSSDVNEAGNNTMVLDGRPNKHAPQDLAAESSIP